MLDSLLLNVWRFWLANPKGLPQVHVPHAYQKQLDLRVLFSKQLKGDRSETEWLFDSFFPGRAGASGGWALPRTKSSRSSLDTNRGLALGSNS